MSDETKPVMIRKSLKKIRPNLWTIGVAITLILALIAELWRFHGVLLLDLWVPIFTGTWLLSQIAKNRAFYRLKVTAGGTLRSFFKVCQGPHPLPLIALPAALFILIGFASLLLNSAHLSSSEFLEAAFYCIRWASTFLLMLVVANQPKSQKAHTAILIFAFATALAIAGFIQLKIAPSFVETTYELDLGWDPHSDRLLATWFDPNFVGGFLAIAALLMLGTAYDRPRWRIPLAASGLIVLAALALTLSRSSYLALIAGLGIFGLLRDRKLIIIGALVLTLATATIPQVQDRVQSLADAAISTFTQDYTLPDQSSRLRFESWQNGWELFVDQPIIGHGYNRYKDASLQAGLTVDPAIHSSSGSDSSILTILATTGIVGLIPFLAIYLTLAVTAWRIRKKSAYAAAFLAALTALAMHSIFVNSLLFPLIMTPFWLAAGLLPIGNRTKSCFPT
jgi:O-antigen ligase